jgi:hypothetical protein
MCPANLNLSHNLPSTTALFRFQQHLREEESRIPAPEHNVISHSVTKSGLHQYTVTFTYEDSSQKSFDGREWHMTSAPTKSQA